MTKSMDLEKSSIKQQQQQEEEGEKNLESQPITHHHIKSPVERRAVRKIDLRLLVYLIPVYLLFNLDRSNIGYARLYGIEKSLNITPDQYSWCLTIFHIGYIAFEIPSNLLLRIISPARWITLIIIFCGLTSMGMGATFNFAGIMITRFFLGLFEAGFFPGMILLCAMWYTRQEQGLRIAITTAASTVAGIISGPLALAIFSMDGLGGIEGWRWVFIIQGLPTFILGFFAWWVIPGAPSRANWLTSEEKLVVERRMTASHVELDGKRFDRSQFIDALKDYKTYLYILLKLGISLPLKSIMQLMPTIINDMGFSTTQTMILTAPPYIFGLLLKLFMAWTSDRTMQRGYHMFAGLIISIVGFIMLIFFTNSIVRYIGLNLAQAGALSCYPIVLSWANNNVIGATKAPTVIAMVIMVGTIGGVGGSQLYRAHEAPNYIPSHVINLSFLLLSAVATVLLRYCLVRENRKLDRFDHRVNEFELANEIIPNAPTPNFRYVL